MKLWLFYNECNTDYMSTKLTVALGINYIYGGCFVKSLSVVLLPRHSENGRTSVEIHTNLFLLFFGELYRHHNDRMRVKGDAAKLKATERQN